MPRARRVTPIVDLGPSWAGIGQWGDGLNRCSRGDCLHYRRTLRPGPFGFCHHVDGQWHVSDVGTMLCVPFYKAMTRELATWQKADLKLIQYRLGAPRR
jgi:hypothetical protein